MESDQDVLAVTSSIFASSLFLPVRCLFCPYIRNLHSCSCSFKQDIQEADVELKNKGRGKVNCCIDLLYQHLHQLFGQVLGPLALIEAGRDQGLRSFLVLGKASPVALHTPEGLHHHRGRAVLDVEPDQFEGLTLD
jgi:hypothetical protein